MTTKAVAGRANRRKFSGYEIPLHLMLIPGIIITFIFHYIPLSGLIIAFQRFIPAKGLFGNQKWIGCTLQKLLYFQGIVKYLLCKGMDSLLQETI